MKRIPDDKAIAVNEFLARPLIARIATADQDGHPHVVPVWYGWDGKSLWISSFVSTRKYVELQKNLYTSVVIDIVDEHDKNKNSAVLFEGPVELIDQPKEFIRSQSEWVYIRYLGEEGVKEKEPHSWTVDPDNRMIKLTPEHISLWGF